MITEGMRVYATVDLTEKMLGMSESDNIAIKKDWEGIVDFVIPNQRTSHVVIFDENYYGSRIWTVDPSWLKPVFEVGNTVYATQNITFGDLIGDPSVHNILVEIGTPGIIEHIGETGHILVRFEDEHTSYDVRYWISRVKPTDVSRVSHFFDPDSQDGGLYIYDRSGEKIVSWTYEEFEDRSAIHTALNAIAIFYAHGPEALRKVLGKS